MSRFEQLRELLEQDPQDPFLKFALAQEHIKAGEFEKSLAYFDDLVEHTPDYIGTYYHKGKVLEKLGRTDEVRAVYETGIKVAQKLGDHHALGELAQALEDFQN